MNVHPTLRSPGRVASGGWSLVELMVATVIGTMIMLAVMATSMYTARSFAAMGNYADLDRASRNTLDQMTRDIRQAKVVSFNEEMNRLIFTNKDNSMFAYLYEPDTKRVLRYDRPTPSAPVSTRVMLTGCDYFDFRIFLRNPTNGFWFPYSANAQQQNTKLVDVSWKCSRRVLSQFNTESVQTAKIVLRN